MFEPRLPIQPDSITYIQHLGCCLYCHRTFPQVKMHTYLRSTQGISVRPVAPPSLEHKRKHKRKHMHKHEHEHEQEPVIRCQPQPPMHSQAPLLRLA
ncbi:hypothetical protein HDV57DRAFT_487718 [Trichoderma longibrachiatum]|uniref:Uncharacterized protein n=1 Tax=Trichoderma longibrachiatum ATCC 18648 TaxID=983965 RepID=A0A2T4BY75_TRILO|nr:hypothetical protein M440DRAFT_1043196 [Trichoderma longibrachiatum ATCC 18648]